MNITVQPTNWLLLLFWLYSLLPVEADEMWTSLTSLQLQPKDVELLHKTQGVIGAGNYTYFSLERPGHILVSLEPQGTSDPDLYVSNSGKASSTEYTLGSATCGLERVHIPASWHRPVSVAVSGGPCVESSKFVISFERVRRLEKVLRTYEWYEQRFLHYPIEEVTMVDPRAKPRKSSGEARHGAQHHNDDEEEEDSMVWNIFVGLLKIVVDILV